MISFFCTLLWSSVGGAQPAPPDLSGTWHIELTITSSAKIPVFGATEIVTVTTLLSHVESDGVGGWRQQHTTCQIDPRSGLKIAQTSIPQTFIDAIADKHYVPVVEYDGSQWRYAADFGPQYIGFDPHQTGGEPPEKKNHPGLVDFEGDGHPAATIHLQVPVFGQVEVYMAQLAHTRIGGTVSADRVEGQIDVVRFKQRSLDAKPGVFASNPEVTNLPEKSVFFMQRVAAGTTCAELL